MIAGGMDSQGAGVEGHYIVLHKLGIPHLKMLRGSFSENH